MRAWVLHNLGVKILSLALAAFLWAVVLGEQKVDVTVSVPLVLDVPPNLLLVNDPADAVEVGLRGPKTLVTTLAPREIAMRDSAVKLVEGENLIQVRPDMFRVPRGLQVVEVNPTRVRAILEPAIERDVEIAPRVEGNPPDGYVVRRVVSVPSHIRMVGPPSELRRIARVRTLPISLQGQTTSFSARVLLEPVGRQVRIQNGTSVVVEIEIGLKKS